MYERECWMSSTVKRMAAVAVVEGSESGHWFRQANLSVLHKTKEKKMKYKKSPGQNKAAMDV